MCGITGFWLTRSLPAADETLRRMTATLIHRGPDAGDQWFDQTGGVGLGHRRLAIVDLTETGRQPMRSSSGRYVTVYNGEIYNFLTLRAELEQLGTTFRGRSDTEVMLAAFEAWGVAEGVRRLAGMFAIAVWDEKERALYLVRDRLGKKPVYYALIGGSLVFGSELKALRQFPGFNPDINRDALALFMRHNYVPGPLSIYRDVHKLQPASILRVTQRRGALEVEPPREYWSARAIYEGAEPRLRRDDTQVIGELDTLLRDAVATRMIADVPLGAFLSGGIDSSLVVALMQAQSSRRVDTFTIGFNEELYDEAPHAKEVARHLGTNHSEVYVTAEEARATIPLMPRMFDEPFSDSSQIPTYLVSKITRRQATVALSGDGGDELFCGYRRYFKWRDTWDKLGRIPRPAQRLAALGIHALPPNAWNFLAAPFVKRGLGGQSARSAGEKLYKLASVLGSGDPGLLYREFVTHWDRPDALVLGSKEPNTIINAGGGPRDPDAFMQKMMMLDILTYLPDDILAKVDRTSMAVSLETRAPLLDHRVVEFAAALPLEQKVRNGESKWLLRRLLERYVPRSLFERPKMGFGIPIDSWLRGPLRSWAEDLLSEARLRREGYFDPAPIRTVWLNHLAGKTDGQYLLWDVLMFQAWLDDVYTVPLRS